MSDHLCNFIYSSPSRVDAAVPPRTAPIPALRAARGSRGNERPEFTANCSNSASTSASAASPASCHPSHASLPRRPGARSDTDRAPDMGVLAREHAVNITFRPESPPVNAWMTGWRRTAVAGNPEPRPRPVIAMSTSASRNFEHAPSADVLLPARPPAARESRS